ncbi:MUT7 Exonuclease, partial [Atractosteus spatula]|nr:MUT7 Exonuclease [Atractosteus spatula]
CLPPPPQLHAVAQRGFSALGDPLEGLLQVLDGCPGVQKGKSSSPGYCILTEFLHWQRLHPQAGLQGVPAARVRPLQLRALGFVVENQPSFADAVLNIFQLASLDRDLLLEQRGQLLARGSYREAALLSMKLKLQADQDVEEVCVPLILLDKQSLAESLVRGHPSLQERLVRLLDSWCAPDFSLAHLLSRYPKLQLSQHHRDRLHPKVLSKQVFRLMERFAVDPALCPNAVFKRRLDSLRFLMYKRFVEKSMTEENWTDHVQAMVGEHGELQCQLIALLAKYGAPAKAAQWALRYRVPRDRLPFGVWSEVQRLPEHLPSHIILQITTGSSLKLSSVQQADTADTLDTWELPLHRKDNCYQLPVPKESIHFLDTVEGLRWCQETVLKSGAVVGFDMEWRAPFGSVSKPPAALIQLAVPGIVFLLDPCESGHEDHLRLAELAGFIRSLFADPSITKLVPSWAGRCRRSVPIHANVWDSVLRSALGNGMVRTFCMCPSLLKLLHLCFFLSMEQQNMLGLNIATITFYPRGGQPPPHRCHSVPRGVRVYPRTALVHTDCRPWGGDLLPAGQGGAHQRGAQCLPAEESVGVLSPATDAYCLLDVYSALTRDPARFGLPADFHRAPAAGRAPPEEKKKSRERRKPPGSPEEPRRPASAEAPSPWPPAATPGPVPPQQLRVVCDNMLQGLGRYLRCVGVDVCMLDSSDDHRLAAEIARTEGRVILTSGLPFQTLKSQVGEGRCLVVDCSEKARDQAVRVLKHFNVQVTQAAIFSRCKGTPAVPGVARSSWAAQHPCPGRPLSSRKRNSADATPQFFGLGEMKQDIADVRWLLAGTLLENEHLCCDFTEAIRAALLADSERDRQMCVVQERSNPHIPAVSGKNSQMFGLVLFYNHTQCPMSQLHLLSTGTRIRYRQINPRIHPETRSRAIPRAAPSSHSPQAILGLTLPGETKNNLTRVFQEAVKKGNTKELHSLLQNMTNCEFNVNSFGPEGQTALHQSVIDGNLELVKLLVKFGADIRLANRDGWSALHIAAFGGHQDIVLYLITKAKYSSGAR